jgi:UDP-N-acetylglucosamine transferase subunit ALG13
MILVTVGTGEQQFDRLLRCIEALSFEESFVVQYGSSNVRPRGTTSVGFMPFADLLAHIREARAVVTHAGVGSTMTALSAGKRPIVMPRRRRFGEAVDDHQVELAQRLAEAGLVVIAEDAEDLEAALRAPPYETRASAHSETALNRDLRAYLASCCAAAPAG